MYEIINSGGWVMWLIVFCSVMALAIILERSWSLRSSVIFPQGLTSSVWQSHNNHGLDKLRKRKISEESVLGSLLIVAVDNSDREAEDARLRIHDAVRHAEPEMERFLNSLGTIASITPLLGLLGTVIGMIEVFTVITNAGVGNPEDLAGGISKALVTTAGGLTVAIPSLMFYRHFRAKVDSMLVGMEQEAILLMEHIHDKPRVNPYQKRNTRAITSNATNGKIDGLKRGTSYKPESETDFDSMDKGMPINVPGQSSSGKNSPEKDSPGENSAKNETQNVATNQRKVAKKVRVRSPSKSAKKSVAKSPSKSKTRNEP